METWAEINENHFCLIWDKKFDPNGLEKANLLIIKDSQIIKHELDTYINVDLLHQNYTLIDVI